MSFLLNNEELTSIPYDEIPPDTRELYLVKNRITVIGQEIAELTLLEKNVLSYNQLTNISPEIINSSGLWY